jgi:hypothetical protein
MPFEWPEIVPSMEFADVPFSQLGRARSGYSLVADRPPKSQDVIAYAVAVASDAVSSNLLKRSQSKKPLSLAM